MSNVKYQHYLARNHMSWFANEDGTHSLWLIKEERVVDEQNLKTIGGQNHLYESDELPRNFIETQVLSRLERDFFAARNRAIATKSISSPEDRQAARRYVAAQFLRQGYLHNRLVHFEQDMIFIAKEIGLDKRWATDKLTADGRRHRASSVMAKTLFELDDAVKMIENHLVTFVERPQCDLLLPDRGFVQVYFENGEIRSDGFKSPDFKVLMPIAPNAALKLVPPPRNGRFSTRTRMGERGYRLFIDNLGLNAKSFVVGTRSTIRKMDWKSLPQFEPNAERLSMVLQVYNAGVLDKIIKDFHSQARLNTPYTAIRKWFYQNKFIPAVNKLFNPEGDPTADVVEFPL
ncbi:hypothetical protein J2767_003579 [Agrobacterium tumefaciens]|uniref:DUF4238 domain-containing protein n=1 Tax=Agrobacterium tumefaciens TaxID=358 RepID=UPI001AE64FE0|nr:DUF4238 domain-containing protein [Agrobacterium tumefaciens]MBP2572401.1 hypothetical protein [Agrobacterium tumefaciens]